MVLSIWDQVSVLSFFNCQISPAYSPFMLNCFTTANSDRSDLVFVIHVVGISNFFLLKGGWTKTVNVKGDDVRIKSVTLNSGTHKAKVTLWRDCSESEVRPGDFIQVTDVITNTYNNNTTLLTTTKSKVEILCFTAIFKLFSHFIKAIKVIINENDVSLRYSFQ